MPLKTDMIFLKVTIKRSNPLISQGSYCGGTADHVYCVPLNRPPRHTVKYACGGLNRAPCIHGPLHRLAYGTL